MAATATSLSRRSRPSNMRRLQLLATEGWRVVVRNGPVESGRWLQQKIRIRRFDRRLGIDTGGHVAWNELSDDPACEEYAPINSFCFDRGLREVDIDPQRDVFLDYGCGKGRAVFLAAMLPFRKVIGVERASQLVAVAEANVVSARDKLCCQDVEIVSADATLYEVPDDVTVFLLHNPFTGHVLQAVVEQIHQSFLRVPRKFTVIYIYPPSEGDVFASCEWLTQRRELPMGHVGDKTFVIHETVVDRAEVQDSTPTTRDNQKLTPSR